ncbi:hypothetical protein MPDQ_004891 [Monascus purpureus]|uniref:gamma-glutamylcyclotransferase n=1 Tax=Monascus purpureus TaxID=5098 RepID=A0A507QX85_MONPU|nr:hypothetical protein MPDQ_004891 [Monascus purpureus]BDD55837.1 hypothetical protein MAP00_001321 [Monascus purpureus]
MGKLFTKYQSEDEETATSVCRFSTTGVFGRLRGILSINGASLQDRARGIPTTSLERQRASTTDLLVDMDEKLPEVASGQTLPCEVEKPASEKTVLYLAYGSNLASKVFLGRRNIKPLSQVNVLVPELRLTFDLPGIPYHEPCFAGVQFLHASEQSIGKNGEKTQIMENASEKFRLLTGQYYHKDHWHKPLVGVVYEVTPSDYARIIATEGGGQSYKDVVVTCYPFPKVYDPMDAVPDRPTTQPFKAHTLLSPAADMNKAFRTQEVAPAHYRCVEQSRRHPRVRPDPSYAQPSARYLNLITSGAAEHSLPLSYREYLSNIRPYRITTLSQRFGQAIFLVTWVPLVLTTILLSSVLAGPDGQSSPWLVRIANAVFQLMWDSYDRLFKIVFGDGERTIGE